MFDQRTLYAPTNEENTYTYLWQPTQETTSSITTPIINSCDSLITYSVQVFNQTPEKTCIGTDDINLMINPTPLTPIILGAEINIPQNNIKLTWESNAFKYDIYRNDIYVASTTSPIYIDPNVVLEEDYCYKVKAYNNNCESEFSEVLCKNFIGLNNIDYKEPKISLYPNPANNKTILKIENIKQTTNVKLFDISGRKIKNFNIYPNQKELEIDLENISNGVYSIMIKNNDFKKVKKLVITK